MYYDDKIEELKLLFQDDHLHVTNDILVTQSREYPIINDVIVLLSKENHTPYVKERLSTKSFFQIDNLQGDGINCQIQYTFGKEWDEYKSILPEHKQEFEQYFDLIKPNELHNKTICDLGCGNGRWSYFLHSQVKTLIMIDFSDAIFVARSNLSKSTNTLFFMGDLQNLPFKKQFADFIFCLGVLHHLPSPCLNVLRTIKDYSNSFLIYLYYSLDNKPACFKYILKIISVIRVQLARIHSKIMRNIIVKIVTIILYYPCLFIGNLLKPIGLNQYIPIYDWYHGKTYARIEQDVYDRFFTSIEQRVSRKEIESLSDTFSEVVISENQPYWHFLLKK